MGERGIERGYGMPLGENQAVAVGVVGLARVEFQHTPIGGDQNINRRH